MKFRPLHDRVVVKRIDAEEKSSGGIIIPDTVKEKPSQGEIVAGNCFLFCCSCPRLSAVPRPRPCSRCSAG